MGKPTRYSPEVRERAVRLVLEHEHEHGSQWATIRSVADKIGCSGETLRNWVRQAERDAFFATDVFLRMNGRRIEVDPDEAHAFLTGGLERGDLGLEPLRAWLRETVRPVD